MSAVRKWMQRDPRRRAPEFDFGTRWRREHDPHTEWALTYNTGTGELYARTRSGDDVEVLGHFADPQDVEDCLPDWGRRCQQPGGLDWVRTQTLAPHTKTPRPDGQALYGVVLTANGHTQRLDHPVATADVVHHVNADSDVALDIARVTTSERSGSVVMWVDGDGHRKNLPVNAAATQLYGTGWPIVGDVVVGTVDRSPLPTALTRQLFSDVDDPASDVHRDRDAVLDWEDHLADRERSDSELGIADDDLDLEMLEGDPCLDAELDAAVDIEHDRRAGFGPDLDDGMDIDR